jgi:hypothetical protein
MEIAEAIKVEVVRQVRGGHFTCLVLNLENKYTVKRVAAEVC